MNIADYIKNEIPHNPNWMNWLLLKCNVFGPLAYGFAYNKFRKEIASVDSTKMLLDSVNFAIKNVPHYREKYKNIYISSVEEFRDKIGFIDKNEVMDFEEDFLSDSLDYSKCMVGTTGGTSGKPLKLVLPKNRYIKELSFVHKTWSNVGWKYHPRGVIRNHLLKSNKIYQINPITKEFIFDGFKIADEVYLFRIYEILKKHKIHFVQAYPSAAYQLAVFMKKYSLDHSFFTAFLCSSENIYDYQYQLIERELNITLYSIYGHSEKLIMGGFEKGSHNYYIEPGYGYFELVDSTGKVIVQPGVLGEMVGTTFYNHYMPLVRYRTGDYAMYSDEDSNLHLLKSIQGRWDGDRIYLNDDSFVTTTALNLHSDIYTVIAGLQYIQDEKGVLTILVVKTEYYTVEYEMKLLKQISQKTANKLSVKIEYVKNLQKEPNGKFLLLKSNIKSTI